MKEVSYIKKKYIDYINNIIKKNSVSHAYILEIDNYDTDYVFLLDFIKMILFNTTYDNIDSIDSSVIKSIDEGNYPDIYTIDTNLSMIKKSEIIDLMSEFKNKSLLNNKKIYIIKEAEKLNDYSANTILKFLEEPENDIIAFLVTYNRYLIIDTILSRCQILSLKENDNISFNDNSVVDVLECILNPKKFFINYNIYINDVFSDKKKIKEKIYEVERIILSYLDKTLDNGEIKIMLDKNDKNDLINIMTIIETELPKLDFNVNIKLWLNSLFSILIGG